MTDEFEEAIKGARETGAAGWISRGEVVIPPKQAGRILEVTDQMRRAGSVRGGGININMESRMETAIGVAVAAFVVGLILGATIITLTTPNNEEQLRADLKTSMAMTDRWIARSDTAFMLADSAWVRVAEYRTEWIKAELALAKERARNDSPDPRGRRFFTETVR